MSKIAQAYNEAKPFKEVLDIPTGFSKGRGVNKIWTEKELGELVVKHDCNDNISNVQGKVQ